VDDAEAGDRRQQQADDQHAFRFQGTNYLLLKGP
jgi:hypothetical protein